MRLIPLLRSSLPGKSNSPRYVGPRHLMKSSSMPPAVVTRQSTFIKGTEAKSGVSAVSCMKPDGDGNTFFVEK